MKRLGAVLVAMGLMLIALPAFGANENAQEVCPNPQIQGGNDVVLPAGTLVCIKGSTKLVNVVADGVSTLQVLLDSRNQNGKLQDVSHYHIPGTTTTTVEDEETTTTTTLPTTTTTVEDETTTTVVEETTTTFGQAASSTSGEVAPEQLPYTGFDDLKAGLAAVLLAAGATVLYFSRRLEDN